MRDVTKEEIIEYIQEFLEEAWRCSEKAWGPGPASGMVDSVKFVSFTDQANLLRKLELFVRTGEKEDFEYLPGRSL